MTPRQYAIRCWLWFAFNAAMFCLAIYMAVTKPKAFTLMVSGLLAYWTLGAMISLVKEYRLIFRSGRLAFSQKIAVDFASGQIEIGTFAYPQTLCLFFETSPALYYGEIVVKEGDSSPATEHVLTLKRFSDRSREFGGMFSEPMIVELEGRSFSTTLAIEFHLSDNVDLRYVKPRRFPDREELLLWVRETG